MFLALGVWLDLGTMFSAAKSQRPKRGPAVLLALVLLMDST